MRTSIHSEVTGIARHSRTRVVLTVYFALSPAIGCFATVALRTCGFVRPGRAERASARLDASIEASGPHDFTVRVCAVVLRAERSLTESNPPCDPTRTPDAARVHRISSRVRDDRDTPLVWDETVADMQVIWGKTERKYFSLWE